MAKIDENYHKLLKEILDKGYEYEDPNRKGVIRKELTSYQFRHEFKDGFPAITTKKLHYKNVATELIWFLRGDTNIKYLVDNGCNIWNKDYVNYYKKIRTKQCYCGHTTTCDCGNPGFSELENNIKNQVVDKKTNHVYGDLGKVYGHYWRDYDGFDQIKDIIDKMINTPMSSEVILTARNPNDKDNQALPCCHYGFQIVMRPLNYTERLNHARNIGLTCKTTSASKAYKEWDAFFLENNIPKYGFELHWQQRSVDTFLG